ncbi:DUF2680 domain-containing protein [Bacillus sp. V59.32b]|uniref:DUF2680 domain-containing protein n=1 Tax=Bacillus sp. V59.32b TaxID=1758642 RepID=UPI000E3B72D2|nr:DUF2680 domain-containing protein [Bacillus sp. V59.32b]RFU68232.1 DUF2680 domain-containing protein [Bacillus sp. V59.32b]
MKKQLLYIFAAFALVFGASVSAAIAAPSQQKNTQLTEKQKTELKVLHKDILEKKRELIQKYVDFGVISKEMGDRMIQRYEDHYKMIEQNEFRMHQHHHHHKHSH